MEKPFFTVIIPTFNRADKLVKCLNSVLSQTFDNFEIVVFDDGSSDNTEKILLAEFDDPRIRYFWQEGSGCPANPRNRGISKSRGVWIAFLDSDDVWYPEKLEIVYKKIQTQSEIDVICHNERLCDQINNTKYKISHFNKAAGIFRSVKKNHLYRSLLLGWNCLSPSATSLRKSFLIEKKLIFNESIDFVIVEDYDLWLHLAKNGAVFSFIDKTLGDYIVDDANIYGDWERYIKNLRNLYEHHAFDVQEFEPNKEKIYNRLIAKIHFLCLKRAIKEKKISEVFKQLFQIFRKYPTLVPREIISKALPVLGLTRS